MATALTPGIYVFSKDGEDSKLTKQKYCKNGKTIERTIANLFKKLSKALQDNDKAKAQELAFQLNFYAH